MVSRFRSWLWLFWLILPVLALIVWGIFVFNDPTSSYNAQKEVRIGLAQLEKDPNNFSAAMRVGVGYYNLKEYSNSVEYYEIARGLDASSAEVWNNIGNDYRELLRFADAEAMYQKTIELKKDWTTPYLNLAELYTRWTDVQGSADKAVAILKAGLAATDNEPALLRAIIEHYEQAKQEASAKPYRDILDKAIENLPNR
jgi:tetratricopeptide (TPR) repeat protein